MTAVSSTLAQEARDLYKYAKTERQREVLGALVQCDGNITEVGRALRVRRESIRSVLGAVRAHRAVSANGPFAGGQTSTIGVYNDSDLRGPVLVSDSVSAEGRALDALLKLVKGRRAGAEPMELEELCDRLEVHPSAARKLVAKARGRGYDVELEDGRVGRAAPTDTSAETVVAMPAPVAGSFKIALVGDIHFGSKQHMRGPFEDYCAKAYDAGVRRFLHAGDLLDGAYKFSFSEQSVRGFDDQIQYAIDRLPRMPGATWTMVGGNHDETFDSNGLNVQRAINEAFRAAGRDDLECIGMRGGFVRLLSPGQKRGTLVELWHPKGGGSYALSYKLQNHIRDAAVGAKPDILAMGHLHTSIYFEQRGVHAFGIGCWQGGKSAFGKSLGGAPSIGSWIVEIELTAEETIRACTPKWYRYYESEAARSLEIGELPR